MLGHGRKQFVRADEFLAALAQHRAPAAANNDTAPALDAETAAALVRAQLRRAGGAR